MGTLKQKCLGVSGAESSITIGQNLLEQNETTSKISIMAPPGSIVQLNDRNIRIGRSGIYDFDHESILITSIVFPESLSYSDQRKEKREDLYQAFIALKNLCDSVGAFQPATSEGPITRATKDSRAKDFCAQITNWYASYISTVNEYRAIQDDENASNENLTNVIVNYIIN